MLREVERHSTSRNGDIRTVACDCGGGEERGNDGAIVRVTYDIFRLQTMFAVPDLKED